MNPDQRIVMQIPMRELWTERGPLAADRTRTLGASDAAVLLGTHKILQELRYAIADVGQPLRWLDPPEFIAFWKSEARGRVVQDPARGFHLEDFPGEYCYVVSEWREPESDTPILLFERHH